LAASSTAPQRTPGPTFAIRRSGSISSEVIADVLSRIPPSAGTRVPCPVAWTAIGTPYSRAVRTAAWTSLRASASATTSGRESKVGTSARRCSSYCGSPGRCVAPLNPFPSSPATTSAPTA
jgi:hypothetical protein